MIAPLAGVRVLQLGSGVAAGYAGKLLADLGASVTCLARPPLAGDLPEPVRRYHTVLTNFLDSGKKTLALSESASNHVSTADIVITTDTLPALTAAGLEPGGLADAGKVVIAITSFGLREENPDALIPDLLASSLAGFVLLTGQMDHSPARSQASLPQFQAALSGVIGGIAALLAAEAGRGGDVVDVSVYEAAAFLMEREDVVYTHQDTLWQRTARHKVVHPFAIFPCRDGYVALAAAGGMMFKSLSELIGAPQLGEDQAILLSTIQYADLIDSVLLPWLAEHDRADICQLMQERRIPVTPVLDFREILADAHLAKRAFFQVADLGEAVTVPSLPYRFHAAGAR